MRDSPILVERPALQFRVTVVLPDEVAKQSDDVKVQWVMAHISVSFGIAHFVAQSQVVPGSFRQDTGFTKLVSPPGVGPRGPLKIS